MGASPRAVVITIINGMPFYQTVHLVDACRLKRHVDRCGLAVRQGLSASAGKRPSVPAVEVVCLASGYGFLKPDGDAVFKTLFVDSGFTGQSCFVLSQDATDLSHAAVPASRAAGALEGMQNRELVICRIAALAFQRTLIGMTLT